LGKLADIVESFTTKDFNVIGVGIPVSSYDRETGIAHSFGNLPWRDVPILTDLEKLFRSPVALENDAKLAGLSESMLREPQRLLYVTVSTGIGYSLIVDREIDQNIGDSGGSLLMLEHSGKWVPWEKFASGKAIVETFGKMAKDINAEVAWDKIARNLSYGLIELIAVVEPELIVIGGSVGTYFDRFAKPLKKYLKELETPLLKIPPVEGAKRSEDAVVYGCYDYAKEMYLAKR
jgi:predicted NBD/HSP70 family sugar kinase